METRIHQQCKKHTKDAELDLRAHGFNKSVDVSITSDNGGSVEVVVTDLEFAKERLSLAQEQIEESGSLVEEGGGHKSDFKPERFETANDYFESSDLYDSDRFPEGGTFPFCYQSGNEIVFRGKSVVIDQKRITRTE